MNKIKIIALSEGLYDQLGRFLTNKGLSRVEEEQVIDGLVAVARLRDMFKSIYIEENISTNNRIKESASKADKTPF